MSVRSGGVDPRQLLMTANKVLESNDGVFDGCRTVTAAALIRQAVELAVDVRLAGLGVGRTNKRTAFLCLAAVEDDPAKVRQLHHTWAQLSDACHATSYELAPSHETVKGWMSTVARFIGG